MRRCQIRNEIIPIIFACRSRSGRGDDDEAAAAPPIFYSNQLRPGRLRFLLRQHVRLYTSGVLRTRIRIIIITIPIPSGQQCVRDCSCYFHCVK